MNSLNDTYQQIKQAATNSYDYACKQVKRSQNAVASSNIGIKFSEIKNSEMGQDVCKVAKKFDAYVAAGLEVVPVGHYLLLKKIYSQKKMQATQEMSKIMAELQKDPENKILQAKIDDIKKAMASFKVPKSFSAFVKTGLIPHLGLQVSSIGVAVSVNESVKQYILGNKKDKEMTTGEMFTCAFVGGFAGGSLANIIEKGLQYQTADKGFFKTVKDSIKKVGVRQFCIQGMGSTLPREVAFNYMLAFGIPVAMVYANEIKQKSFGSDSKASEFLVTLAVALGAGYITSPLETCRAVQHNSKNPNMSVYQAAKQITATGDIKKFFPGANWRNTRIFWYLMVYPAFKEGYSQALSTEKAK